MKSGSAFLPAFGAGLAAGASAGTAILIRKFKPAWVPKSELIGAAAGILASAALLASKKTRPAGVVGLVVSVVNGGLRALESQINPGVFRGGFGIVSAANIPTLGAAAAYRMPTLGAAQIEPRQMLGRAAQLQGPVQLVGAGGLGAHYGATCMG